MSVYKASSSTSKNPLQLTFFANWTCLEVAFRGNLHQHSQEMHIIYTIPKWFKTCECEEMRGQDSYSLGLAAVQFSSCGCFAMRGQDSYSLGLAAVQFSPA
ncbi:hypothetical protein N9289_00835 [Candidatus Poseidonia sp.]|nr:hypothetical protein [Poseidonia sp.]